MHAARPAEADINAGTLLELRRKVLPAIGGSTRPGRVLRTSNPFALHPYETEVSARRSMGHVTFVQQVHNHASPGEAVSGSGADHSTTDHGNFALAHCIHKRTIELLRRRAWRIESCFGDVSRIDPGGRETRPRSSARRSRVRPRSDRSSAPRSDPGGRDRRRETPSNDRGRVR